ncbi:MAG: hypothetical protein JJT82_00765 [Legionellaceae bacterium]|nr:hypothetical protein [Legionellaceae bacterium]
MQIHLEQGAVHSIQAYSEEGLRINHQWYRQNIILHREAIITEWPVKSIRLLDTAHLPDLLEYEPEIIIIGHQEPGSFPPMALMAELAKKRIGLESMSITAACRTFNILLSEERKVVLGIIW